MAVHKLVPFALFIFHLLGLSHAADAGSTRRGSTEPPFNGTKWAVLVAGSSGYSNYRHQADVCHAYQVLKNAGLKDENIIVFMYDDIANHKNNPRKGVIINMPNGPNVYHNVPKDYTGENVTVNNLLNVILGNKHKLTGGSGKVLDSGPSDHVFIFYADHGSPGVLGMPSEEMYADDFINALKRKHESNSYAQMVIYIEACESGSIFDGLLPKNWNIYATTAANPTEDSYATYCDADEVYSYTCLGDLYSVSWIEDSEESNLSNRTLAQQYLAVKERTLRSHVMEYGDISLSRDFLSAFMGSVNNKRKTPQVKPSMVSAASNTVDQRETELYLLRSKYHNAAKGSKKRREARKQLAREISSRKKIDRNMKKIVHALFGLHMTSTVMETVRTAGKPLVDNWKCLKTLLKIYKEHCGEISAYGLKYTRAMANMCNAGVTGEEMALVSAQTCGDETNNLRQ